MFNFSFRRIRNAGWWSEAGIDAFACNLGGPNTMVPFPLRRELVRIDLAQAELEN